MSLLTRLIDETPFVVIDVETTGLDPETERVVEICAALVQPDGSARILLDTLVDPEQPMKATAIHGITDADVVGAPRFATLVDTVRALVGRRVVAGHNIRFDLTFLDREFNRLGESLRLPHLCTMRLPALFDRPANWPLWWACQRNRVPFDGHTHSAQGDARATAGLLRVQLAMLREAGLRSFGDIAARGRQMRVPHSFVASLARPLSPQPPVIHDAAQIALKPRVEGEAGVRAVAPERRYLDAVVRAVADLRLTAAEVAAVAGERARLQIDADTARRVHGRILAGAERRYSEDGQLDPEERANLDALRRCLAALEPPLSPMSSQPADELQ